MRDADRHVVTVSQNSTRNLGCDGTSGWIWEAARKLEDFLVKDYTDRTECASDNNNDNNNSSHDNGLLAGHRILELGSGTGFLALRLALLGATVTATDRPGAMKLLVQNISSNVERIQHDSDHETDLEVDVQQLDWESDQVDGEWDVIIGSDVLYHQEHHRSLFEACIRHGGKRCIFAWEERIPKEEKAAIALAELLGFRVDSLVRADYNSETLNVIWVVCLMYPGNG